MRSNACTKRNGVRRRGLTPDRQGDFQSEGKGIPERHEAGDDPVLPTSRQMPKNRREPMLRMSLLSRLRRAEDAELPHLRLQGGTLHAEPDGGSGGTPDHPVAVAEGLQNMFALGLLESGVQ